MTEITLNRSDIHRPSAIIPADYEYVAQEYLRIDGIESCEILRIEREKIERHMAQTGGNYSGHEHGGNCMVCGAAAVYTVLFYHAKTNAYVRMGQDCAMKCELGDTRTFRTFRSQLKDVRERQAGKAKAQLLLTENEVEGAWAIFAAEWTQGLEWEERTIRDIVEKLVRYGSLSEKQYAFLGTLLNKIDTRADRKRKQEEERAKAKPCPTGRMEITGTVLSTRYQESDYGETLKMLVQHDDGWKVWGTVPDCIQLFQDGDDQRVLERGDRVKFKATITPSEKDEKFGFFKRPTGAMLINVEKRTA